ncbi:MAG TPA: cytochrome c [Pyrinomonadaceae bacterium]|jgi:mono/diheme cytochrome c family protein
MKLLKLAIITCVAALLGVACASAPSTNQPAANANAPTATSANTSAPAATPVDQLADTRKLYGQVCARCHGDTGAGGEFEIDGKKDKAPTLRAGHAVKHPDAELAKKISAGGDGMPAFGKRLSPEQINNLVRFIRQDFQGGASASSASNDNHAAQNTH